MTNKYTIAITAMTKPEGMVAFSLRLTGRRYPVISGLAATLQEALASINGQIEAIEDKAGR